jgi:hypothetical protein
MATTNYTITGQNFLIKTPSGEYFQDGGLALVQWELGYNPKYRPVSEWVMNPINVSWTAWYNKDYTGVGQGIFGSNGTQVDDVSPIFLFIDFGNASNFNPSTMGSQVWMGQITDILVLNGGNQVIDLNSANILPVIGSISGNTFISEDWNNWQPTAIPEPSYSIFAVALFAVAVIAKKLKWYA